MSLVARPLSLLVLVLLAECAWSGRAAAQDERPAERIHVDVEDADLGEVLRQIARQVGASLVVDPRVQETVTVSLRDIPWRECVDVLARMTRCEVVERPAGMLLVTQPSTHSATFEDAAASTVLHLLAAQGGERVWVDPAVSARVSVTLAEATWPAAVRHVADAAGLQVAWIDGCALVAAEQPDAGLTRRASLVARFPDARRVSLETADDTPGSLVFELAVAAKLSVIVDEDAIAPTSIGAVLRDVPWAEAMDLLLELADCTVDELPGGVLHVRRRARVTLEDAPVSGMRDSLRLVAAYGGLSLVLSPGVAGSPAISCHGLPADLALALIARRADLHLWTDGDVVVVSHVPLVDPPAPASPDGGGPAVSLLSYGSALSTALDQASATAATSVTAVDPSLLERPVFAHLVDVPWRQAIAGLARHVGFVARFDAAPGGVRLVVAPGARVEAAAAPATGWFTLLAHLGGVRLDVPSEVDGPVTASLHGVAPRRAIELTAWAGGHHVEERDGVLRVAGEGFLPVEVDPVAPTRSAAPEVDDAAEAARREELTARVDDLLKEVVQLAEGRAVEELIVKFTELRQLMSAEGPLGTEVVRERLAAWRERLQDLGEVRLSLQLQMQISEGNHLLRAMADAIREDRFADAAASFQRIEALAETMRTEEREVFHRNAEALYLRGKALFDRSQRLERAARLELRVTAVAAGHAALINGAVRRQGDAVLADDGVVLRDLTLVEVGSSFVRLRLGDTEFIRELGR